MDLVLSATTITVLNQVYFDFSFTITKANGYNSGINYFFDLVFSKTWISLF